MLGCKCPRRSSNRASRTRQARNTVLVGAGAAGGRVGRPPRSPFPSVACLGSGTLVPSVWPRRPLNRSRWLWVRVFVYARPQCIAGVHSSVHTAQRATRDIGWQLLLVARASSNNNKSIGQAPYDNDRAPGSSTPPSTNPRTSTDTPLSPSLPTATPPKHAQRRRQTQKKTNTSTMTNQRSTNSDRRRRRCPPRRNKKRRPHHGARQPKPARLRHAGTHNTSSHHQPSHTRRRPPPNTRHRRTAAAAATARPTRPAHRRGAKHHPA